MYALGQYALGIIVIHAAWFVVALVGSVLVVRDGEVLPDEWGKAWLIVILSTAVGLALLGFAGFFFGIVGLLNPVGFCLFVLVAAVGTWLTGLPITTARFWSRRASVVRMAVAPVPVLLYAVILVLALPAALPPIASDAGSYYLAYALEWAQHHSLFVDIFRRSPYYPNNWVILYGWFYALHVGRYVLFLTWLAGGLSIVTVSACIAAFAPRASSLSQRAIDAIALVTPLPVILSPLYLHWLTSGLIDPAHAFMLLAALVAVSMTLQFRDRPRIAEFILCAGFFVGMKVSFIAFLPLFGVLAFVAAALVTTRRMATLAVVAVFLAASPWYVRNFIQTGDPVPPLLNLSLRGTDSTFDKADLAGLKADLNADTPPARRVVLPIIDVMDPQGPAFREYGTTPVLICSLFAFPLSIIILVRRRRLCPELVLFGTAAYSVSYWMQTSQLGRYSILFLPLLALMAGAGAVYISVHTRGRTIFAAVAVIGVLAIPSPSSWSWLHDLYYMDRHFAAVLPDDRTYLQRSLDGYSEEEYISDRLAALPSRPRVYVYMFDYLAYYYGLRGIEAIGDWSGPARYRDLKRAIVDHRLNDYVTRFNIGAFEFRAGGPLVAAEQTEFARQITTVGFRHVRLPKSTYDVYIR